MKACLVFLFAMMATFSCWADSEMVSVAQKYVDALQSNPKQAFSMLTPKAAKMGQQQFDQFVRFFIGKGMSGLAGVEIGAVLFSKSTETHALVIFTKKLKFSGPKTAEIKGKLEKSLQDDFPADQLAGAKKVIRMEGQAWVQPLPIYLQRETKTGPWLIDAKGENFPFQEFRGELKKKFGANLLRYAGEDLGDPGCNAPKAKNSSCFSGEDAASVSSHSKDKNDKKDSGCILLETNKACGADVTCYFTEGDEPVPCKKGQESCVTFEGNACAVR
ncbi:MAG: hypothetical protein AABY86_17800 [Bdellovibrionota bacterium]